MISIAITDNSAEVIQRLDGLPARLRAALESKMKGVVDQVYAKAVGTLSSGKYLATDEVQKGVETQGDLLIGFIEPISVKAQVQETGTDRYYEIYPSKARALRFIGKRDGQVVFSKYVFHPPIPGKHYIRDAINELAPMISAEFEMAIREGLK